MIAPIRGPRSGPISTGIVSHVIPSSTRSGPKALSTMSRPTGGISAPPNPCNRRAATMADRVGERPASTEPRTKTVIAAAKTRRVPNRSANQPEPGMKTARPSR